MSQPEGRCIPDLPTGLSFEKNLPLAECFSREWLMSDLSRATQADPVGLDERIDDHFHALAIEFQRAIDRLPDHPDSADMLQSLQRGKALVERGAALARELRSE